MKLPFPSRQPSILHSSPLWLIVCSTQAVPTICFGTAEAELD